MAAIRTLLVLSAVLGVASPSAPARPTPVRTPACVEREPRTAKVRSIREVDWCNRDLGGRAGRLRGGHAEVHLYRDLGAPHDTFVTHLIGVAYGDVDGDGRDEAAVIIESVTWIQSTGEARSYGGIEIDVYQLRRGRPERLGSAGVTGPVHALELGRGGLVVRAGEPAVTTRYRPGADGDWLEVGAPAR